MLVKLWIPVLNVSNKMFGNQGLLALKDPLFTEPCMERAGGTFYFSPWNIFLLDYTLISVVNNVELSSQSWPPREKSFGLSDYIHTNLLDTILNTESVLGEDHMDQDATR